MADYRRFFVPGGTFFFTVVTYQRRRLFDVESHRTLLGNAVRHCRQDWPFEVNAIVLLPDHLHAIWTLPRGDTAYSGRWSVIKKHFTKHFLLAGGEEWPVSEGTARDQRRGVWQRRFWEHMIRDEDDFQNHFDYIHYNPVKHGLAPCPRDWQASSFHRWVRQGVYPIDWACSTQAPPVFANSDYGEPA